METKASASGESLPKPQPLFPAIGELLGLGEPGAYLKLSARKAPPSNFRFTLTMPSVRRNVVAADTLGALRATARAESPFPSFIEDVCAGIAPS